MKLNRRSSIILMVGPLACLVGCHQPEKTTGPNVTSLSSDSKQVRAAIVLAKGGVDDRSFNAAAVAGLNRAKTELKLGENNARYVESKDVSDYKSNLTLFASQGYDIVFAVGYQMAGALQEVAPQFPNVKFAIVDAPAPDQANCVGLLFREQEGAFLAGFLAASMTRTKKIGFVGGERIPIIERVESGYRAGARTADPKVSVIASYTGDWNDPGKGKSQAEQQFSQGADIILQGAGKSGLGVIEAARARGAGYYAIGTDQNQDDIAPGRVLTTFIKHTDFAVFDTIRRVQAGQFEKGNRVYGIKEDAVGLSDMHYTRQSVPPQTLAKLDKIKQMIAGGAITPPTTLKELDAFRPPTL